MIGRRVLVALLLFVTPSTFGAGNVIPTVAYPFDRQVLERQDIGACAAQLLKMSGYGRMPYERAAFLVLRQDGAFDCSVWPATFQSRSESWTGRIPQGTVAIIHTHPLDSPDPSPHDAAEAVRMAIPVIVATPEALAMALPRGGVITTR